MLEDLSASNTKIERSQPFEWPDTQQRDEGPPSTTQEEKAMLSNQVRKQSQQGREYQ